MTNATVSFRRRWIRTCTNVSTAMAVTAVSTRATATVQVKLAEGMTQVSATHLEVRFLEGSKVAVM